MSAESFARRHEKPRELSLQALIDGAGKIAFFGGAGVSTESGIPDFRSAKGLYNEENGEYSPETILSSLFFCLKPDEFYDYYRSHLLYPNAVPNAAHRKLAELERAGKLSGIVTQNIDGLHRRAGSRLCFELHGNVNENTCVKCGKHYGVSIMAQSEGIPHCKCSGVIKPGIVLYGEPLDMYVARGAKRAIADADLLIVAGTSLSVEPAASFIKSYNGKDIVVINKEETPLDEKATLVLRGGIAEIMSKIKVRQH
ncbi:MAG: NAD-dependent protein deacylase [Eubacteriales bacterium]|nr:NAD-dependent protein deacylase [Eubacteriales bacterium]MDD3883043.1 NAD-dependent protein deacylase [Eubacteriales bacterium]MDD4513630.1 NAD-dependent protein deacylase [Eubacteriales bacterium]